MVERTFRIENLACPGCAREAVRAIVHEPGVLAAHLSVGSGSLRLTCDEGRLTDAQLVRLLRRFGLEAKRVA